jgi:hypothetical protein
MKKLYYLDESEKERILNLHNKHKGNLLTESEDRVGFNNDVREKCKKYESIKPTKSTKELNTVADGINSNIMASNYASDETEKNIKGFLSQIKTTADFCSLYKIYKTRHARAGGDLLGLLSYEFFNGENWKNHVKLPILDAINDYNENITASTENKTGKVEKKGWDLYKCVIDKGAKPTGTGNYRRYSENLKSYITYKSDGTFFQEKNGLGVWEEYYCDSNGEIQTQSPTKSKTDSAAAGAPGSGTSGQKIAGGYVLPNAFTPEKVSTIKTAVGSTDKSGSLTQDDINKLYAKLSQK